MSTEKLLVQAGFELAPLGTHDSEIELKYYQVLMHQVNCYIDSYPIYSNPTTKNIGLVCDQFILSLVTINAIVTQG